MKHILLLILFSVFGIYATAQSHRFADSTAQWNILTHQYGWFPSTPETYQTTERKVVGDTTIGGMLYQNIDNTYYIRRAPDQKVYTLFASQEVKLYDFGAAVGDTIEDLSRSVISSNISCVVDSADTVNWLGLRKRMHLSCFRSDNESMLYADEWVDGIGSIKYNAVSGYVHATVIDGWEETLLCFFENGQVVFHDTNFDTCYYRLNVGISTVSSIITSIYPNPAIGNFIITLSQQPESNTAIFIYDALGKTVEQEELTTSTQQINVAELPNGMYTYAITQQGLRQASGKLIISK